MTDPITMAIATAVATKGAESLGQQAGPALAALVRRIRERFTGRPAEEAALAAAEERPEEPGRVEALAEALQRVAREDPGFGGELRAVWQRIQVETTADHGVVANTFDGRADKVVQFRDIHGDFTIS
ncbi:hypothetical protein ACRYCC_20995 [Actinomadura scrupuli]|uniref:hypothetical protein n=1 Tax=Actinomadura scrupuli TaxID=559629 RepID=UPI003D97549A